MSATVKRLGHLSYEEERALAILKRHRNVLEDAARELLKKETLAEPDVAAIAGRLTARASPQTEENTDGRPSVAIRTGA